MIVKYNNDNINIIPIISRCEKAVKAGVEQIKLVFGNNVIKDEIWEDVKKYIGIDHLLETKVIEEIVETLETEENGKKKTITAKSISSMSIKKAEEVVSETNSIETLEEFKVEETRPNILKLIDEKIKEIKK